MVQEGSINVYKYLGGKYKEHKGRLFSLGTGLHGKKQEEQSQIQEIPLPTFQKPVFTVRGVRLEQVAQRGSEICIPGEFRATVGRPSCSGWPQ